MDAVLRMVEENRILIVQCVVEMMIIYIWRNKLGRENDVSYVFRGFEKNI